MSRFSLILAQKDKVIVMGFPALEQWAIMQVEAWALEAKTRLRKWQSLKHCLLVYYRQKIFNFQSSNRWIGLEWDLVRYKIALYYSKKVLLNFRTKAHYHNHQLYNKALTNLQVKCATHAWLVLEDLFYYQLLIAVDYQEVVITHKLESEFIWESSMLVL